MCLAFLLVFPYSFPAAPKIWVPMLPQVYSEREEVPGWLMSEKLDGVRARWDGLQLLSKNDKQLAPPKEFIDRFPPFPLVGELWGGRGTFEQTLFIVSRHQPHSGWLQLKFAVFDAPEVRGGFRQRMALVERWLVEHPCEFIFLIPQTPVRDRAHLQKELRRVERLGGEGLIVRTPDGLYTPGRSSGILKVKRYQDAEARVVAHPTGQGKYSGQLGSLQVELSSGRRFRLGSGFSGAERQSSPPVGSTVTSKYDGTYASGIPQFPSFFRLRSDQGL